MKRSQTDLKKNLQSSMTGLEKFLDTIEAISEKQRQLLGREGLLQQFSGLAINDQNLLRNLFKGNPGEGGSEQLLKDLLTYHELLSTVDHVRAVEDRLKAQSTPSRSAKDYSILRQSLEQNLKQVSFKALQFTIGLINRDFSALLQLPEAQLVRVLKPIGLIPDIRPSLLTQYEAHQRLRIRDVLADYQINIRKDQIDVLVDRSFEALLRFCAFDVAVLSGRRCVIRNGGRKAQQRLVRPGYQPLSRADSRALECFQEKLYWLLGGY
jgi:hypothetical protein